MQNDQQGHTPTLTTATATPPLTATSPPTTATSPLTATSPHPTPPHHRQLTLATATATATATDGSKLAPESLWRVFESFTSSGPKRLHDTSYLRCHLGHERTARPSGRAGRRERRPDIGRDPT
ncbi:hypothetical protein ACIG87_16455 [Micromonospora sp. NPDC051925]|uniref:hypothetical protein n=1 Tax=Micromonospora sp. NPDC051925 TaxID=3364288 RepID=UPI0037C8FCD3